MEGFCKAELPVSLFCSGDGVICSTPIGDMEQAMDASDEGESKMSPRIMARGISGYSMLPVRGLTNRCNSRILSLIVRKEHA